MKIEGLKSQLASARTEATKEQGFADKLLDSLKKVDDLQKVADEKFERYLLGEADTVELVSALSKAELSFKLLVEVRNKLVSAIHELLRMQV